MIAQKFTAKLAQGIPIPAAPQTSGVLGIGRIGSDGTVYGNSGFTCDHSSTGVYTITHNLNLVIADHVILATPATDVPTVREGPPETSLVIFVTQQASNSFTIEIVQGSSLTPMDAAFNFGVFQ